MKRKKNKDREKSRKTKLIMYTLQKPSFWKRIASFILDAIIVSILVTGFSFIATVVLDYDSLIEKRDEYYEIYEKEFGIEFDISSSDASKLTDEEKQIYQEAYDKFNSNPDALKVYNQIIKLSLIIPLVAFFLSYLIADFIIPLILKNGQTIGKKVFGVCIVKKNGVKVEPVALFVRTVIGKFAIETVIPLSQVILFIFSNAQILNLILVGVLVFVELGMLIFTKDNSLLHDALAYTSSADMSTQIIFNSEDERLNTLKEVEKEKVRRSVY